MPITELTESGCVQKKGGEVGMMPPSPIQDPPGPAFTMQMGRVHWCMLGPGKAKMNSPVLASIKLLTI